MTAPARSTLIPNWVNVSSSCRKRKGTMVSVTGSDQGCSDAELGAKPKKRTCVTTSTTEPAPVPANPRKSKKGMAATTKKKNPSVAAWLKTLQAPPAPLTPPTRPPKTSTPAKELTFNSVSVCSTPGVFNSTEISESVPTPPACEISNVAEISFGSTRSSDNAHLNEALDRSEACHDFENPDLATKELLTAACEASKAEIENYCGQNGENLEILAHTSMVYSGNERLSSGHPRNEHGADVKFKSEPDENMDSVAPDSTSNPVKSAVKVEYFDENFLIEARRSSAAVWESWVKARASDRGEKRTNNFNTFKLALDAASKKMYRSPVDACLQKLEGLNVTLDPVVPNDDGPSLKPLQLEFKLAVPTTGKAVDLGEDVSVLGQSKDSSKPLMVEMGDVSMPFCENLLTQDMFSGTVGDKAQHMAGTCVIGCEGMERTNGKKT